MENIRKRILEILAEKGLSVSRASALLEMPQRALNRQLNEEGGISMELIRSINKYFPDVSIEWILNGNGNMHKEDTSSTAYDQNISPYYNSITVSAGVRDSINDDYETSDAFVSIPGMKADFFFPVVGTSMQPEINPGDIIGVNRMDPFATVDEERVYMIVTHDSRFIKHCTTSTDDNDVLVCTSPNYPSFTVRKDEIVAMYDVL